MRYPTIHGFLAWVPTAIFGAAVGVAAIWSEAKDWISAQVVWGWHQTSSPMIAVTIILFLCAYVLALLWTAQIPSPQPAKEQAGVMLVGEGLDHVSVTTGAPSRGPEARFFPYERREREAGGGLLERVLGGARAVSLVDRHTGMRGAFGSIGDMADTLTEAELERKKQATKRRMRGIRDAAAPPAPDEQTFDEAWEEAESGWIPFVRLRDFAPAWGVPLPGIGPGQNNAYWLEGELRQAAVRGKLKVEGRQYRGQVRHNDPLVPISPEHFRDYGFGHGVLNYDEPNDASHTGDARMMTLGQRGKEDVTFYDLHLLLDDTRAVVTNFARDPRIKRP